eukprot:NODE_8677_length_1477_cov_6.697778.p1 GENE.NODE_8677_length_1477_cov_6.697778~~NODE_8677_length_1477_cov_6.697778.p1  ORF type:complete len:349 (+),score=106.71 NODE_8677_length_1477_cov_6.697778:160-1206(+)
MGVDVLKKIRSEARARQNDSSGRAAPAGEKPRFEPPHRFFVSSNWKSLLERRPQLSPKAASQEAPLPVEGAGAASNVVALDCEMVGIGPGGTQSTLARASIVDNEGTVLLDVFVRPKEYITDFRSHITGITAATLHKPGVLSPEEAKRRAAALLEGKIVVGHAVQHDFEVLDLEHPRELVRDTALFRPLRPPGREHRLPSLARLSALWLQEGIHTGEHNSVEDARMALRLYQLHCRRWEKMMRAATRITDVDGGAHNADEDEGEQVKRRRRATVENAGKKKRRRAVGRGVEPVVRKQRTKKRPVAESADSAATAELQAATLAPPVVATVRRRRKKEAAESTSRKRRRA